MLQILAAAILSAGIGPMPAQAARDTLELRALTPDDVLGIEDVVRALGSGAFSPDGRLIAFVRQRARAAAGPDRVGLDGNDRGDVWLAPADGGPARNLTRGAAARAGYWAPLWSPDGRRLAMLSTKGGDVQVWVWERASGRLYRASDRGINSWSLFSLPCVWTSNTVLLCQAARQGRRSYIYDYGSRSMRTATQAWSRFWTGRHVTASVVESGAAAVTDSAVPMTGEGSLARIDVVARTTRTVFDAPSASLLPSPDRRHVAVLRQVRRYQPSPERIVGDFWEEGYQLVMLDSAGMVTDSVDRIPDVRVTGGQGLLMQWSPDGTHLAVLGRAPGGKPTQRGVYTYEVSTKAVRAITSDALRLPEAGHWSSQTSPFAWATPHRLVLQAVRQPVDSAAERSAAPRADWWLLEPGRPARNLTAGLPEAPGRLFTAGDGSAFIAVAGGTVWRIGVPTATSAAANVRPLTDSSTHRINTLLAPSALVPNSVALPYALAQGRRDGTTVTYRMDTRTGRLGELGSVAADAILLSADPTTGAAAFFTERHTGTSVSVVPPTGTNARPVAELNGFLRQIAEGELRRIRYTALDGDSLTAWLILPPGYTPGRRYPMVVWVYSGSVHDSTAEAERQARRQYGLNNSSMFNLQLLAARGFAVLLPSMPHAPGSEGKPRDESARLPNGVLPAVDRVVALGIADSTRVAVMGHSRGGYSTMNLITQTGKFRAAIASAGPSNWVSFYGTFLPASRYTDDTSPFDHTVYGVQLLESGSMRAPPWVDPQRYVRDSPVFHAGSVTTPLLLLHGDMDGVPLQQSEEFFTALYRQGKRARLVRYWGEGHVLDSPANIRDFWKQVFAWLDEHLDLDRGAGGALIFAGDRVRSKAGRS